MKTKIKCKCCSATKAETKICQYCGTLFPTENKLKGVVVKCLK